jgi:suppressor for copper-sensitivity B
LRLAVDYLVCEKICIPYQAALALDLPAGPATPSEYAHLIDRFVARVPGDGARAGLALERASWSGGPAPAITVTASADTPFQQPDVFIEGAEGPLAGVTFGRPAAAFSDQGRRATLRVPVRFDSSDPAKQPALSGTKLIFTLVDGARAMEARQMLVAGLPSPMPIQVGFAAVLGIALLGGLVLNLMPCVLPVLALKLLNIVGHAGVARARIRRNFIASAAGILASFLVLAIVLAALKLAGATVGWGIQFQQPAFLVFMTLVLTLFTANLWGWFDFRLPGAVADAAASGEAKPPHEESATSAFFAGAFATLLATPCSAPFVGTAVGFALARGPLEIVAVFLALGLGLALPYLAVALIPGLAARLPRPGRWMNRLRAILGAALLLTAGWLLSIAAVQVGPQGAAVLAALLIVLLAVLWATHAASGMKRLVAMAVMAGIAVLAFLTPTQFAGIPATHAADDGKLASGSWQNFDLGTIETLVHEGRVVLVDVTAEWCLTCQVNKAAVLSRGEIAKQLTEGRVVPMRADWTRPDPAIAHYLASFGRYGIPFNVVYGPGAPAGIALPEILTADVVLDAFDRAQTGSRAEARP